MKIMTLLNKCIRRAPDGVPPGAPPAIPPVGDPPAAPGAPSVAPPVGEQFSKDDIANLLAENALFKAQNAQLSEAVQKLQKPASPAPSNPTKPLDQMNGAELMQYLQANSLEPTQQTVMNLAVQLELMNAKETYGEDFVKAKDDVYKICSENPSLSLEQGYLLFKGRQATMKGATPPATPPSAPSTPPAPPGHHPGIPPDTTQKGATMTVHEATLKALKDLNIQLS